MINSLDEATQAVKQLCLQHSDEKLKDVLLFYFKELQKSRCKVHVELESECRFCRDEIKILEAFRGISILFSEMTKLSSEFN